MRRQSVSAAAMMAVVATLAACTAPEQSVLSVTGSGPRAMRYAADWSEPEHVGPPVSSSARELGAWLSDDRLSMYFASDRDGTLDVWVARRDCRDCDWTDAVKLGPEINSSGSDGNPEVSVDGHYLFFISNRAGSTGNSEDVWVSHRADTHDDLGWETAVNVGPFVNSTQPEAGPTYATTGDGPAHLYFSRGGDIYVVAITHDGVALAPATAVAELNTTAPEMEPSIRGDGKEIYFWSSRAGGVGQADLWRSTRQNVNDPWGTPTNLGVNINTNSADLSASISRDGRTLTWSAGMAARPSLGFQDVWMSTRMLGARPD